MEKASGELNLTVITIVAIAAIAAFFYAFVWPAIRNNIERSQRCNSAVCPEGESGRVQCIDVDNGESIWCNITN